MTRNTPSRRRAHLTIGGLALGAALAIAAPLAASAHVHVSPEEAAANASTRLDFTFSHGCDGAPTTSLVFDIPDGVDGVTPVLDGAWTIARETGDDGIATRVTYTAVNPVEDGVSASVAMNVIFSSSTAESAVAFPVLQTCETGETNWAEVAEDGQDPHDLEAPAPAVAVGAAAAPTDDHGGDGHSATDDHSTDEPTAGHDDASPTADPVARWLSGGALVAALAALGVAVLRRRKA